MLVSKAFETAFQTIITKTQLLKYIENYTTKNDRKI